MFTSPTGIDFIKKNEGWAPVPYDDDGHLAWAFGHDQQPGETPPAEPLTEPEGEDILVCDLETRFEPTLIRLVPATATQNQKDACADFCYNEGPRNFATMIAHGWDQVPANMPKWCYAMKDGVETIDKGLQARRAAEVALFNT